jgi:23S rRNA pseudouridine2605 synthase
MRINKFVARATGMGRRAADAAISEGRVTINLRPAANGSAVGGSDAVRLDSKLLELPAAATTVMLNKPVGYVCSRDGQGSRTIYDLLPADLHHLKPVGRLDKDSSGLILLTDDGELANRLTHPRYAKQKIYEIRLDKPLSDEHKKRIETGVKLDDGPSRLKIDQRKGPSLRVSMSEGRNRQIRRTFAALGYEVRGLHRTAFGPYDLGTCSRGRHRILYTDD